MPVDLVQIHHSEYLEDIPFWTSLTDGRDPVLEVGCGHGRVTVPLLRAGRMVTGIDVDGQALGFLADLIDRDKSGLAENLEIIQADIFRYQADKDFGAVIIPCNTFSTFFPPNRSGLLKMIHGWLKPGGLFAASVPNPINLMLLHEQLISSGEIDQEVEATLIHPETRNPVQVSSRFRLLENGLGWDWIYDHLLPDGQVERTLRSAEHHLADPEIYQEELQRAGFEIINTLGEFEGGEYSPDSPYLILTCRK